MTNGATPIDRKTVREAIGTGLTTACTKAQAVYSYAKVDFGGLSPVVRVASESAERPALTRQGIRSVFRFVIDVWVLLSNQGTWTEKSAEDALDALELEIVTWITSNQNNATWTSLAYDGASQITVAVDGGDTWLIEKIPIRVEVHG